MRRPLEWWAVVARLLAASGGRDRGAYTAELAVALPSLIFVLACALLGVGVADGSLRCQDAARAGARALARGEPRQAVMAAAREAAPNGASIQLRRSESTAEVRCRAKIQMFGLHTFTVKARAVSPAESPGRLAPAGAPRQPLGDTREEGR
ncbi:MAG: TadE family type IV pilus minor pilin [Streptosporangiales bacterium]